MTNRLGELLCGSLVMAQRRTSSAACPPAWKTVSRRLKARKARIRTGPDQRRVGPSTGVSKPLSLILSLSLRWSEETAAEGWNKKILLEHSRRLLDCPA